ncbi:MAG: acyl-CoA carboxylase subunit epsilon [Jatrophihabitans sp.]|nr:MAG: acyl-CoA carboxylase subunit epsilon [Jatrophihabitans sp.]
MASRPSEAAVLQVRGNATGAELAVLTALLASRASAAPGVRPDGPYERWRRTRLSALRDEPGRRAQ